MDQLDPLSAADEAVARISAGRRVRRHGRLYSGDDASRLLQTGAISAPSALSGVPAPQPVSLVPLGHYETPAPVPAWGMPPRNPFSLYSTAQANAPKIEAAIAGGAFGSSKPTASSPVRSAASSVNSSVSNLGRYF